MSFTDGDRIRAINDRFRQNLTGGRAVMTPGIAALGPEAVARLVQTIAVFDNFCHANDPHEEHDFGRFKFDEVDVVFKIEPTSKWRWLKIAVGIIAAAILAIGVIGSYSSDNLEFVRRDLFDAAHDGKVLEVTNIGNKPIKLINLKVND